MSATPARPRVLLVLRTLARVSIGAVWLVAGAAKVTDPLGSANAVRAYQALPDTGAEIVGYALPWAEISLGLLLVAGIGVRLAATTTTALMGAFIFGVAQAWARGLSIDCGCFGGGGLVAEIPVREYLTVLVRDTTIAAFAIWLALRPHTLLALTDRHHRAPDTDENIEDTP